MTTSHFRRFFSRAFFAGICFSLLASLGTPQLQAALVIRNYSEAKHYRFSGSGDFIGSGYDSSGVGRTSDGKWLTMISDTYALTALHNQPGVNATVDFFHTNNSAGMSEKRTVVSGQRIGETDLALIKLNSAVSSDVAKYSIAEFRNPSGNLINNAYIDEEIYTYGLEETMVGSVTIDSNLRQRLGRNTIDRNTFNDSFKVDSSTGNVFLYDYDETNGVGDDESRVEGGDSGAPSFMVIDGKFTLVGIHWFKTLDAARAPTGSGDTLLANYTSDLNGLMENESVTIVPEPSGGLLLAIGMVIATSARRRRG